MKARIFLFFNPDKLLWPVVRKLLEDAERKDVVVIEPHTWPLFDSFCSVRFDATDPRLPRLRTLLSNEGVTWLERREHIFTTTELEAAPLLWLMVRKAQRGNGGPEYGTEYDLSQACPRCGTGALQTSHLRLDPSEIPKKGDVFRTLDGEILVSLRVAQALDRAEVSGLELRLAQSHKAPVDLPWVQLIAKIELPPMAPSSKGISREDPCPRCGRDGYFNGSFEPVQIEYYSNQIIQDELPDVVRTYERFGNSKLREQFEDSHFAEPILLVKPKVFKVLRQERVRGLEFVPVNFV